MKNNQVSVRLDANVLKALRKMAKKLDLPLALVIRHAIRYYIEAFKT